MKILIQFNLYEDYKTHLNLLDLTIFPPLKAKRQTSSGVMAAHRSDQPTFLYANNKDAL